MRIFVSNRRGALAARLTALLLTVVAVCTSAEAAPQGRDGMTPTPVAEGQASAAAPRRAARRAMRCRCRHRGRRHCKRRHRRAHRHASRRSKARRAAYLSALYRRLRGTKPPRGVRLARDTVCFRHGRHHVVVYPDGGLESLCELPGTRIWVTALSPAEATDGGTSTEPCLPPRALAPTGQARARGRGFERTPGGYRPRLYLAYAAPKRRGQNSPARFHWRAHVASARLVLAPA